MPRLRHACGMLRLSLVPPTVFALALTAVLPAQLRGGDILVTDYSSDSVFVVSPGGAVSTLHTGLPLQGPSGIAVTAAHEVLVADYTSATLFRLPPGGAWTPVITGLRGPIRVAVDRNGDYLLTELSTAALSRVTPAGVKTTIHAGAPFVRPFGIAVDGDGEYLVADDGARALFRVTLTGVTTVHAGLPFRLPQGVTVMADGDYAVMDGLADALFVVPRAGGAINTLIATPTLGNPCAVAGDFEGRVLVSESSASSNRVVAVDRFGVLTVLAQGLPFANLEAVAKVPNLQGPVPGAWGQNHPLTLDLPTEANRGYVMFASASLHPGIPLGGVDPRGTPCNPDGLFFLSIGASNAIFTAFSGVLNPNGQALANLNLPALTLPQFTFFLQGFSVNFQSAATVGVFTNVHALRL